MTPGDETRGGVVSTRSATGAGARLGRPGRGRQVLLEHLTCRAVAGAAPGRVVEPVGEPQQLGRPAPDVVAVLDLHRTILDPALARDRGAGWLPCGPPERRRDGA